MLTKKIISALLIVFVSVQIIANEKNDSLRTDIKKGWSTGGLPALGYDSNLGFNYGAIVNMFDYGDGSNYPNYDHNLYLQLSRYTKGSMDAIAFFDSYALFPSKQFTGRLSFNRNGAYPFYGFNAAQSIYNSSIEIKDEVDYISPLFYRMDRNLLKADLILQDFIGESRFKWMAGADLAWYSVKPVDIDNLNKGRDANDLFPNDKTLYDNYIDWGLISDNEKLGGFDNTLKLGLVYDTRDRLTNPMKGMWTELITRTAPAFLGNESNYMRLSLIHRQYVTLVDEDLSFAYRLWYDASFGNVPFYARQYLSASNFFEGMGGAQTLRGVLLNRIIAKQSAIANLELRWKAVRFKAINQNFYIGLNAFADAGMVLQSYALDMSNVPAVEKEKYFDLNNKDKAFTAGLGLKLVMNENFVISADYAKSLNKNFGESGFYIMVGYLF